MSVKRLSGAGQCEGEEWVWGWWRGSKCCYIHIHTQHNEAHLHLPDCFLTVKTQLDSFGKNITWLKRKILQAGRWWLTPGGRDQEDHGSKPVQANSFPRPYLEKSQTKRKKKKTGLEEWLKLKLQYYQKKKNAAKLCEIPVTSSRVTCWQFVFFHSICLPADEAA
jgi:hypothetical protein